MPLSRVVLDGFGGGINRSVPANEIAPDELVEAVNYELDTNTNLRVRGGTTKLNTATALTNRITSVYYFRQASGAAATILTEGAKVRRFDAGTGALTDITSTVSLPSDTYWEWVTINDWAIGCNQAAQGSAHANPVKLETTGGTIAALGGSPKKPTHIEAINDRLFLVPEEDQKVIRWSALGDIEDWTTTGSAGSGAATIGGTAGGPITAIRGFQNSLIIFMRDRIYALQFGEPNGDARQWFAREIVRGVGCVSSWTIQSVLGDLVFLSDEGLMSLRALLQGSNIEGANLSAKVPEIAETTKAVDTFASAVLPSTSQYFLSVPKVDINTNERAWVMDYTGLQDGSGRIAWTEFDGKAVGASMALVKESGENRIYVGGYNDLYRYADEAIFEDDGFPYTASMRTGAITLGEAMLRKDFQRLGVQFAPLTTGAGFVVSYTIDEDPNREHNFAGTLTGASTGALFDSGFLFDNGDVFFGEDPPSLDFERLLIAQAGRRGQSMTLGVDTSEPDGSAFIIKTVKMEVLPLTRRQVAEV